MKKGLLLLSLMAAVLITGCDARAESLEWYKTHDKERDAKVEECKKVSAPRGSEDCRNAIDASLTTESNIIRPKPKTWTFE